MPAPWEKYATQPAPTVAPSMAGPSPAPWERYRDSGTRLSGEDVESPIPTDLIQRGREAVDEAELERKAQSLADYLEQSTGETGAGELFGNAFTLGLKDKVAGLASGVSGAITGQTGGIDVGGFIEGFNVGRRAQEILEERARARSGRGGQAAELAGTIATGALAKAPAAATAIGRTIQGAREAGTLATVQGVGDSESDSVLGTAGEAVASGLAGAATGGVLTGALEIGRGLFNAGRAGIRAATGMSRSDAERGAEKVYKALSDDDVTPELAAARMRSRDTALINVGDENTLGLGRAASAKPGEGRKIINSALDAQQRASQGKVLEAVTDALGGADQSFNRRVADMVKTRANLGNQAYEAAFAKNFQRGHSMVFDDLAQRIPGEAVRNAQRIAKAEGRDFGEQLIASVDDMGNVTFRRAPSLREWHYIQRGLRAAADNAYRSGVGEVGAAYKALHKEILNAMDEASPLYRKARRQYSSQSEMIDAIQRGREILNPSTTRNVDALADELASMSKAEKEMVKIGLARQIEDMLATTPDEAGDMVKKIFGTKAKRDAIRAVFDNDKAFRAFEARMGNLAKEAKSFRFVRTGSRTSFVDAEKQSAGAMADAAQAAMDAASGTFAGTAIRATMRILRDAGGMDEGIAREVAKLLVEKNPDVVRKALAAPASRKAGQEATDALLSKARPFVRAVTAGAASSLGAEVGTRLGAR